MEAPDTKRPFKGLVSCGDGEMIKGEVEPEGWGAEISLLLELRLLRGRTISCCSRCPQISWVWTVCGGGQRGSGSSVASC